jgi:hypothetical protein
MRKRPQVWQNNVAHLPSGSAEDFGSLPMEAIPEYRRKLVDGSLGQIRRQSLKIRKGNRISL